MTQPLVIVGAGGFARETAQAVRALNTVTPTWDLLGFLDDDDALHGNKIDGVPVLGPVSSVLDHAAAVVICTGRPDNYFSRKQIVNMLASDALEYATIVHPSCSIAADTIVGAGSVFLAGVTATAAVDVGNHVAVMPQTVLTHDDRIGDFATVTSGVRLGGGVTIGDGAYIGAGALLRQGLTVGSWSLIGMGAVVLTSVPAAEVWAGSPARKLRDVALPENWKTL